MEKKHLKISVRASPRQNVPVSQGVPVTCPIQDVDAPTRGPHSRRSLTPDGRLVSCLKDTDRTGQLRRSRSVKVRFVRTPRDLQQQRASLEEGSVLVGRSPPVVHDRSEIAASSPRSAIRRLQEDGGRHGYSPPETARVVPRSARAPVTVARVQVRGDLDTTVIGEVYRENVLRYTENLKSTSTDSVHVPYGEADNTNEEKLNAVKSTSTKNEMSPEPLHEQTAPKTKVSFLGERENIKVIYAQSQRSYSNAPTEAPGSSGRTLVLSRAGSSIPASSTGGHHHQEVTGGSSGSRMTAKVIIRRRKPAKERQDSDSDSLDRIDVDHRPTPVVRRTMSLRVRPRQVWTPDQSVTTPGEPQPPPVSSVVKVRRSVSLRILPKRNQQGPLASASVTDDVGKIKDKMGIPNMFQERNGGKNTTGLGGPTNDTASKAEDRESVSTPAAPAPVPSQSDLLASCMGGLGQSSTKWLAEQNRKRALKTLEPVTKFAKAPAKHPFTVCFDYAGTGLTHKTVKAAVEKTIGRYRDTKVVSIQFVPKSIILSSMWVDNRWVVKVNNANAQRALTASGVNIFGKDAKCRLYDDVLEEEYKRFLEKEERTE